jgi:hypothetical protein
MTADIYKQQLDEESSPGWDAIDTAVNKIYGTQEPEHFASAIKYIIGGPDPIDGTSIYDSYTQTHHKHLISYGMSELYFAPEKVESEFSGWGFEFTFRVKCGEGEEQPKWAIGLMNNLARYVFQSGNWFEENHYIPANGPIKLDYPTDIVGLVFITDPELGTINTPHGTLVFLQMVGITSSELEKIKQNPEGIEIFLEEMRISNPLFITDLDRKDI